MKAVVTYFDDAYFPAYRTLIKSILKSNPDFNLDVLIYDWGISSENRKRCLSYYNRTTFLSVDKSRYALDSHTLSKHYFGKNFQKFEILNMDGYDRILVIDADYVVLGSINDIFKEHPCGFFVDVNEPTPEEPIVPYPDTGLMLIDSAYLGGRYYEQCLEEMKSELKKDVSENSTASSNEYVFERVFGCLLTPFKQKFRPCGIDEDLRGKYFLVTPQIKHFGDRDRYKEFMDRLPWNDIKEIRKSMKFVRYINENGLVC